MNKQRDDIFIIKLFKRIKLRNLILLILLLSFNSYAWFIYATKVSTGMSAHISSWNVHFQAGEEEIKTEIMLDFDIIYPGMEIQSKTVTAYNTGETLANLSYEIKTIRILDTTYTTSETLTQEAILSTIDTTCPFDLTFEIDNSNLNSTDGRANFTATISWPMEGNDVLDTEWGELAYKYNKNNPTSPSIHIELVIKAIQATQ